MIKILKIKKMKKFINSTERKVYDETGNVKVETISKTIVHKTDEDSFYMTFTNYIMWMCQVKSVATLKILYKLLEQAEFNTGNIDIPAGVRTEIETTLDICKSQFTKSITELINKNVLWQRTVLDKSTGELKPLKGCYTINPEMFWKGDLKTRRDLRVTFESIPTDE